MTRYWTNNSKVMRWKNFPNFLLLSISSNHILYNDDNDQCYDVKMVVRITRLILTSSVYIYNMVKKKSFPQKKAIHSIFHDNEGLFYIFAKYFFNNFTISIVLCDNTKKTLIFVQNKIHFYPLYNLTNSTTKKTFFFSTKHNILCVKWTNISTRKVYTKENEIIL